jgi:hypothetical protein
MELLDQLIEELSDGCFAQRRSLLEFYECSLEVFTKKFWTQHCYKGF